MSILPKLGCATSQDNAGYAVTMARAVNVSRMGWRPSRSETAPITGNQNKFETPTQNVTMSPIDFLELQDVFAVGRGVDGNEIERDRRHHDHEHSGKDNLPVVDDRLDGFLRVRPVRTGFECLGLCECPANDENEGHDQAAH